ncbi:MAG: hypothetical protein JO305_02965 [Alphaproteobacteria bacterium]|nr:hypothetical protein [Alphaproteobacteria bacterium]
MSALGHYLEEEGIATVAISLIRAQTENTKPPRALWVPFELGRPFGPPDDAAFQRRVLLMALQMLERDSGPVIIEDFPDDDPRAQADPGWCPPLVADAGGNGPLETLVARLQSEILQIEDAHRLWAAQNGRTMIGLSGLSIRDCARYVADWLNGRAPKSPRDGFSAPLMLRFAVDDLKACYLEAGAAGNARPSSRQLGDWFWDKTAAGAAIHRLREVCLGSEDERLKLIAGNFLVPAMRVRGGR